MPIRHGEGSYFADETTIAEMEMNRQILVRYCDKNGNTSDEANRNGSARNIAGIMNREGNVFGLMPHPEAASEAILGSVDGLMIFRSMATILNRTAAVTSGVNLFNTNTDPTGNILNDTSANSEF